MNMSVRPVATVLKNCCCPPTIRLPAAPNASAPTWKNSCPYRSQDLEVSQPDPVDSKNLPVNLRADLSDSSPQFGENVRPLKNVPFYPIPALDSDFNPRNTPCMPVVKIFACLELEQN